MSQDSPDLDAAYALQGPDDNRRLYADWAGSYDSGFAAREDYQLPELTAREFARAGGQGPVLDVGAGTGLCGAALDRLGIGPIDATDLSADMLDVAMRKDIYRDAIAADLHDGIPVPPHSYRGVVSSGTFTHGHVGPDVLEAVLRVARPGAQFALSVNAAHYTAQGFEAAFERLLNDRRIHALSLVTVPIYGERASGPHKDDMAFVVLFEKA